MKKKKGTKIDDLPETSDNEADTKELAVLNNILDIKKTNPKEYNTLKFVIYATLIFFVLSLPFVDRIIELAIPMCQSWLILIGLKVVVFFILYYIVFYFNRNS